MAAVISAAMVAAAVTVFVFMTVVTVMFMSMMTVSMMTVSMMTVSVAVAIYVGIIGKGICQKCAYRLVRISLNAAVQLNSRIGKRRTGSPSDTAANESVNLIFFQKACQRSVPAAIGINYLR